MHIRKVDRCLAEIQSVQNALAGLDSPYVARSRIGRLCTSVASFVMSMLDKRSQDLPGQIELGESMPSNVAEIVNCCNRIFDISRHTSQPSEALDAGWRQGFDELFDELAKLESLMTAFCAGH